MVNDYCTSKEKRYKAAKDSSKNGILEQTKPIWLLKSLDRGGYTSVKVCKEYRVIRVNSHLCSRLNKG